MTTRYTLTVTLVQDAHVTLHGLRREYPKVLIIILILILNLSTVHEVRMKAPFVMGTIVWWKLK